MKKLFFVICLVYSCLSSEKISNDKGQIQSKEKQIYLGSVEVFNEINNLRKENGKTIPLSWDNILFYLANSQLSQIQSHPKNWGNQLSFEKSYFTKHLIKSFGQIVDVLDFSNLNSQDIVQQWKQSPEKLEVLLADYQIGSVGARTINGKLYMIAFFANSFNFFIKNQQFIVMIAQPGRKGVQGDQGDQGEQGNQGPQGEKAKAFADVQSDGQFLKHLKEKYPNLDAILNGYNILPNGELAGSCQEYKEMLGPEYHDGVYQIKINERKLNVYCEDGWIVLVRRTHDSEFYQDWQAYADGFGDYDDDFWIGLQNIFELTRQPKTLQFDLWSNDLQASATYQGFTIQSGDSNYTLSIQNFVGGELGNSFMYHNGMPFSTYDRDNDDHEAHCANHYKSGWWFKGCHMCNVNSPYNLTGDLGLYYQAWKNPENNKPRQVTKAIMKIQ